MTKKSTDASSILGAARRASEVQRPQTQESEERVVERRVNVALRPQTHKRLKLLSVQRDTTVQKLVDELLQEALASHDS